MSVNYESLLWQELNKNFGDGVSTTFVMRTGQQLLYSDYDVSGDMDVAAYNTFQLVNETLSCAPIYTPNGSNISTMWSQLLIGGRGPNAGPQQQAAFDKARKILYKSYPSEKTTFYTEYDTKLGELLDKKKDLKKEMKDEYGDDWEVNFDEQLEETKEYRAFQDIEKRVGPHVKAIREWEKGPLANTIAPLEEAFNSHKRTVTINKKKMEYYYTSMIPANWYQWFDPQQPTDGPWIEITVGENSENRTQHDNLKKLGGSVGFSYGFIGINAKGSGKTEKSISTDAGRNMKISFKVRSVQINRPWLDQATLKIEKYTIPGFGPGSWSTGELNSSNNGSFPLLSTQLIVAKDIKVTADKFNREVSDTMKSFDASAKVGLLFGLFSFGVGPSGEYSNTNYSFAETGAGSSITLEGTQVIGYTCSVLPKYPK